MNKLIVCIMGQNCQKFIGMCLESVKDADAIVYCDGGSTDRSAFIAHDFGCDNIFQKYDQEDKQMNGKQRNFYLNYLKKNYPDDWCLCLDADEVVEDLQKIKEFIQTANPGLYSVHMRHLIQDLAHEDSTVQTHWVLNRLFKISEADKYPEVEHPVLIPKEGSQQSHTGCTTIWHLAYIPNLWDIKNRYDNHMKKSNMHTPEFLKSWYLLHLFGDYPKKKFDPVELPSVILKEFGIDKDELYFQNRGVELKHPLMVKQWYDYFKPESVLDLGCGRGPYLYFWKWFVNSRRVSGMEISEWAVSNAFTDSILKTDISLAYGWKSHDLITAFDVLEHLDDTQLERTIDLMVRYGKRFLISVPVIGDPNLLNDKTHKQFKTKAEWESYFLNHGIKLKATPKDWLFAPQIFIGEK